MTYSYEFKKAYSLTQRKAEAQKIRTKYPDKIPVIVQRANSSNNIPDIDKKKFLVPQDLIIGQFIYVIRKRIKLSPEAAIFVFFNNMLKTSSTTMAEVYNENKDKDGFLYAVYASENTFG